MSLFNELKRRNVFRVGLAYLAMAWVVVQVASLVLESIKAPDWVMQFLLLMSGLGFVIALIISWAYELTPEGIKKERDVVRDDSITNITAKKLDYITLAAVVMVLVLMLYQQFNPTVNNAENIENIENNALEASIVADFDDSKSIAVLPFANMANNAENEPFTLGLHDDLLTHLSRISALKVISRTSVMEYKNTTKKIKDIASELGVTTILEGGVQRSGNQIRLNVQLIDAKTDEHLWAEIYDRELSAKNIFKIQTEISLKIAQALKAQLTPEETSSIENAPTENLQAYDTYLAARQLLETRKSAELNQALALFKQATELDPNYALAYVGQAIALDLLTEYGDLSQTEMFAQGEPLITKALALNPLLAEAHTIKANYLKDKGKYVEAESSFKLSLSLNPNYATTYHWYGLMLRNYLGRYEEALALHRKAAELDPLSKIIMVNVADSLMANGQSDEALQHFKILLDLYPEYAVGIRDLAFANNTLGNFADAIIGLEKVNDLDPGNLWSRASLGYAYLDIGDLKSAHEALEKSKQDSAQDVGHVITSAILDLLRGNKQVGLQRISALLENDPDNANVKRHIAYFYHSTGDCDSALNIWRTVSPEMFTAGYLLSRAPGREIVVAWCLQQTGETNDAKRLLEAVHSFMSTTTNKVNIWDKILLQAVQGRSVDAAKFYAEMVASKNTSEWYWFDLQPWFADMRKEPVFIKAREQLLQDIKQQRALLAEYRQENSQGTD